MTRALFIVTPAKAGAQVLRNAWFLAFAGMTATPVRGRVPMRTLRFAWRHGNSAHPIGRLGNVGAPIRCHLQHWMTHESGVEAHETGFC